MKFGEAIEIVIFQDDLEIASCQPFISGCPSPHQIYFLIGQIMQGNSLLPMREILLGNAKNDQVSHNQFSNKKFANGLGILK